jgi:hypothetical protein
MNFKVTKSQIRTLKQSDPNFVITDGLMQAPRAGFEINKNCPQEYRQIIAACIDQGWLKPIANVTERELIFMGLTNNHGELK